jgi:oxygen-independent coproporphyrinogen-3 oxidase
MTAVTPELLRRFDVPGPRYTSFPTADRFVEAFGAEDYILALEQRKSSTAARAMPLSLYVHVPFCESLCYYCACNKIVTRHHDRAAVYLDYLAREMALHTAHCGKGLVVRQMVIGWCRERLLW